ncbi:hypothetical protein JJJ17_04115 [Paracoccus caeni]|uniref:Lipoprotein n=1 Tax=Paracoccus caeni TaxID=657651 RepID=A0A934SA02_9RHOB|nr:hypothetical protein [Paracoccus caeni]MBK4215105.1 hypothetical protein [Paracoccus caeni]
MRGWLVISVLALAGCGEHMGWNPNYQFAPTPYGEYRATREQALVSNTESPVTIPVALPSQSFTPEQIAGRSPVPVPATMGVRKRVVTQPAQPAATVTPAARPAATVVPVRRPAAGPNAPTQIVPDSMLLMPPHQRP